MKHLLPTKARNASTALTLLFIFQMLTNTADAQEQQLRDINVNPNVNNFNANVNLNGNQSLSNRAISIPTGPNGLGSVQAININVIDNGTVQNMSGGPNVRGYTASVIPKQTVTRQTVNKPKTTNNKVVRSARPKTSVAGSTIVQRPKPKANTTTAAPVRRVVRPAITNPPAAAPVVAQAPIQAPMSNPVALDNNVPLVVEQVMNNDVIVQTGNVASAQTQVAATTNVRAVRSSAGSTGSGSSGKSHKSGRKKQGSFYYTANKKMMKLFAKNKKGKFDPAKCFVWN